jgi:uncharacterized protein YndB with AHSA1/START domain
MTQLDGTDPDRDHTATFLKQPGVRLERLLPGPIERVWAHLTDPKLLPAWFGDKSSIEPRQGGAVRLMDGHIRGTVTQWQPPRLLTYTWNVFAPGDPTDATSAYPESYLTLRLQKESDKVLLVLTNLPILEPFEKQAAMGWHTFLDILSDTLASQPIRTRRTTWCATPPATAWTSTTSRGSARHLRAGDDDCSVGVAPIPGR